MPSLSDFINWAVDKCNEANIGYSQDYRNQQTVGGVTYYDCSSFVNYALLAGGWSTPDYAPSHNAFTTYTMIPVLLDLGWEEVPITGEWKQGDILWRQKHTEIVYEGGQATGRTMGAHSANYALARQVSINTWWASPTYPRGDYQWKKLYRYTGNPDTPSKPTEKISMYVIAAMCGNFMQESQINPGIWQNHPKRGSATSLNIGLGLGQWTNTGGDKHGRLYQMWQYCSQNGGPYNGDAQCDYIVYEDVWHNNDTSYGYTSLSQFLSSTSTDIEALTHAWNINWEGIHDGTWDKRVEYARLVLNYLTDHSDDQVDGWVSTNDWITQSQMLNNAVLVYQHFNDDGGVNPDPEPPVDDGLHVVTMVRQGNGEVSYRPTYATTGTTINYSATPDEGYTFDRWVVRWPYDLSLPDQNGTFHMPDTDVVARGYFSDWDESGPYSDGTRLNLLVTGQVDMTVTWYTQDGGSASRHITFDSNEQTLYTYNIGITDDVHITVNSGTKITPVTRHVPGWTDNDDNSYFFFQPAVDVTLNVVGKEVPIKAEKKKSKWWMYMRPTWTWN